MPDIEESRRRDRIATTRWAQEVLAKPCLTLIDTETTGLRSEDEVVQVACVSRHGHVLLNALMRPSRVGLMTPDAAAVNGLRARDLDESPLAFRDIATALTVLIQGRSVVAFHASFDERLVRQTYQRVGLDAPLAKEWIDLKRPYSIWVGAWDYLKNDYHPQHLPGTTHDAVDDARAMLAVLKTMAAG